MIKKAFIYPSKNLQIIIPLVLILGFGVGSILQLEFLRHFILPATFLMIYPTMIGFRLKEAFDLSYGKVILWSLGINFLFVPLTAYGLGIAVFAQHPQMFAGLAIASLLPTSGMTISWTMLSKGNVGAAIKMTVIGLLSGSFLAPWYLLLMVGKYVPIDILHIMKIISIVVIAPLILGSITYRYLAAKYSLAEFNQNIKPLLPAASVWAMIFVIFISINLRAKMILGQPQLLLIALLVLLIFYLTNFLISTLIGRWLFSRNDALALVFGTVMRNLSIALGIAVSAFGPEAALVVTLAFIIQVQGASWYAKAADKFNFFPSTKGSKVREKPTYHSY